MKKITLLLLTLISFISYGQSITWDNGPTDPDNFSLERDQTLSLQITYDTGSHDLRYVQIVLERWTEGWGSKVEAFGEVYYGDNTGHPASGTQTLEYELPSDLPLSADIGTDFYYLKVFFFDWNWAAVNATNFHPTIVAKGTLSTKDFSNENSFTIYPNPIENTIYLKGKDLPKNYKITNLIGKTIKEGTFKGSIDASSLSKGLYFLIYDNKTFTKFIKK